MKFNPQEFVAAELRAETALKLYKANRNHQTRQQLIQAQERLAQVSRHLLKTA